MSISPCHTQNLVFMIVPIKDKRSKNTWVFLKPWTLEHWVTSGCFFVFIGFVVWVLEHRVNDDFQGPREAVFFSLSTVVFAHGERVVSYWARLVVIIWCVVVLILTQSYTASLTSMLTVQQLQPTVTDVNLLLKNGDNVGYQTGSFIYAILRELGFHPNKVKTYNTTEQLHELFQNGSKNHSISAAFDEIPYIRLFLATYCSRYTMLDPTYKAEGFAFVFPKGSPLARDVSRAILNVNEGGQTKKIEHKWFSKDSSCPDLNKPSSQSLGIESFWGLFLIAGGASLLALLVFFVLILIKKRRILMDSNSGDSLWTRIVNIIRTPERAHPSPEDIRLGNLLLRLLRDRERLGRATELARRGVNRLNSM